MVGSNIVSGLTQGAIAVLLLSGNAEVWHLMALGALNGLSSAFFLPAAVEIVPETVRADAPVGERGYSASGLTRP